jgi:hypothetical protein
MKFSMMAVLAAAMAAGTQGFAGTHLLTRSFATVNSQCQVGLDLLTRATSQNVDTGMDYGVLRMS